MNFGESLPTKPFESLLEAYTFLLAHLFREGHTALGLYLSRVHRYKNVNLQKPNFSSDAFFYDDTTWTNFWKAFNPVMPLDFDDSSGSQRYGFLVV